MISSVPAHPSEFASYFIVLALRLGLRGLEPFLGVDFNFFALSFGSGRVCWAGSIYS